MIKQTDEIQRIIDNLSDLLTNGWLYYFCAKSLDAAYTNHEVPFSRYFFMGCYFACLNESILTLSKLLSEDPKSISIYLLLNFAKKNPEVFSFATTDELMSAVHDHAKDLRKYRKLKTNIKSQRDKKLAHLDREHIYNPTDIQKKPDLDMNEVEDCYREIHRIINAFKCFVDRSELSLLNIEEEVPKDLFDLLNLMKEDFLRTQEFPV